MSRWVIVVSVVSMVLVLAASSGETAAPTAPGPVASAVDIAAATRRAAPVAVNVTATEFKFRSSRTAFQVGVPYHFVVKNAGTVNHDFWVVPQGVTDEKQAIFGIDGDNFLAGKTKTVNYTFKTPGKYDFACFIAGHYESGMHLTITVK